MEAGGGENEEADKGLLDHNGLYKYPVVKSKKKCAGVTCVLFSLSTVLTGNWAWLKASGNMHRNSRNVIILLFSKVA